MKHVLLIVSACVIALSLTASTPESNCGENVFNMNMNIDGRYVQLIMKTKPFKSSEHAIMWRQYEIGRGLQPELIDGKILVGMSDELPKTQIDTMYLLWGDERISIPSDLYVNCYDPTLLTTNSNKLAPKWEVRVSDDRRSLLVKMSAGEGEFAYSVDWVFAQDGKHQRYLRPGC